MLSEVSLIEWIKLGLAILIFPGIGQGVLGLGFNPEEGSKPLFAQFILSFVLSASLWSIVLPWLRLLNIHVLYPPAVYGISLLGWSLWALKKRKTLRTWFFTKAYLQEIILWATALIPVTLITYKIRYLVAALGSDSYHHTLITSLFLWNGGLPDNYSPAVPNLVTFNYHYGFHATSAILSLLSGWNLRILILMMMPILVGLSGLSLAYFVYGKTKTYTGAIFSSIIPTLISIFPLAMLEWGRYPQTFGLVLLPVFLLELQNLRGNKRFQMIVVSVVGAGLLLTHYRVVLMGLLAVIVDEAFAIYRHRRSLSIIVDHIKENLTVAALVGVLTAPWLLRVFQNQFVGYANPVILSTSGFYSLNRLGTKVLEYPTNYPLLIGGLILAIYAIFLAKDSTMIWIVSWIGTLAFVSEILRGFTPVDIITVIISLYVPVSITYGWGIAKIQHHLPSKIGRAGFSAVLVLLSLWGGKNLLAFLSLPLDIYVYKADLRAAEWIQRNIPENALFMVNTYRFDFSTNFIIGIDAGGWLPLLAKRQVVTYPMTTGIERFVAPNALQELVELHQISTKLETLEGASLLVKYGITHVYVGKRGGPINPKALLSSSYYDLLYHNNGVYIFAIKPTL